MSYTFLPINTFNAGVNPPYHYNDPMQFYDPISNVIANSHSVVAAAQGTVTGNFSGTATSIQTGTALDPGTVGGISVASAFLKLANASSTTVTGATAFSGGVSITDPLTGNSANSHQIVLAALGGGTGGSGNGVATSIAAGTALDPGTVSGTAIGSAFLKVANATSTTVSAAVAFTGSVSLYDAQTGNSANSHQIILAALGAATGNYSGTATSIANNTALDSGTVNGTAIGSAFLKLANASSTTVTGAVAMTNGLSVTNILAVTGNATISGNTVVSGTLTMTAINLPQVINLPTSQAYVTSPSGTIAAFTGTANGVNYIAYQSSTTGNPPGIVAVGETTGGLTISSSNGQLQLNCYNTQDILLGKQNMLANGAAGFPCIPCVAGLPTGTPGTNNGTVQAGWQSPIITSNNSGTYALYAWVNYGWRSVQLGGSYITSAALPATSGLYGGSGSAGQANAITIGSNLSLANGVLSATGGGGGGSSNPTVYLVNTSNSYSYSGTTSTYIKWNSNAASIKYQTIPTANAALAGVSIVIKDGFGNAGTAGNAITITPLSNTCTIDGQSSLTIATNYGYARLFCDGGTTDWSTF